MYDFLEAEAFFSYQMFTNGIFMVKLTVPLKVCTNKIKGIWFCLESRLIHLESLKI